MKNNKLKLKNLKVQSFITEFNPTDMNFIKGGDSVEYYQTGCGKLTTIKVSGLNVCHDR